MSPIVGLKGHTFLTSCGWPFLYSSDGTFLSLAGATSTLSRHAHAGPWKRASSAISPLICRNARPVWLSRRPANSVWRLHVNALTTRRQGANTLEEQWFQQHLQHMISEAIVPYKHLHHVLQPWQPKEVANLAATFWNMIRIWKVARTVCALPVLTHEGQSFYIAFGYMPLLRRCCRRYSPCRGALRARAGHPKPCASFDGWIV